MGWLPWSRRTWESPRAVDELFERLTGQVPGLLSRAVTRTAGFSGAVSRDGFDLRPVVWGQASFLPRIIGRWNAAEVGSAIDVQIVPNPALQLALVMTFAVLGLLVYDQNTLQVMLTTSANLLLGWILLQSGHGVAAALVERQLRRHLDATPVAATMCQQRRSVTLGVQTVAVWTVAAAIVLVGGVSLVADLLGSMVALDASGSRSGVHVLDHAGAVAGLDDDPVGTFVDGAGAVPDVAGAGRSGMDVDVRRRWLFRRWPANPCLCGVPRDGLPPAQRQHVANTEKTPVCAPRRRTARLRGVSRSTTRWRRDRRCSPHGLGTDAAANRLAAADRRRLVGVRRCRRLCRHAGAAGRPGSRCVLRNRYRTRGLVTRRSSIVPRDDGGRWPPRHANGS